ncbi:MarR family winged helix-turn-helix transcriptional regulator [Nocardia sp. IFM 10818]
MADNAAAVRSPDSQTRASAGGSGGNGGGSMNGVGDTQAWDLVLAVHAWVEKRLGDAVRRQGLGLSEFRALEFLATTPGGQLRMQDLAQVLGLNQSSVTRLVERLHQAQFAHTRSCSDDGRGVYAAITEQGRARYTETRDIYRAMLSAALDEVAEAVPGGGRFVGLLRGRGPQT